MGRLLGRRTLFLFDSVAIEELIIVESIMVPGVTRIVKTWNHESKLLASMVVVKLVDVRITMIGLNFILGGKYEYITVS